MMFGGGGTYILQWTFSWKKRRMMERRPFIFFILSTILMTKILLLPSFDGRETPRLHKRLVFNSFATHTEETAGIIVFWSFYSLQFWTPLPVHHLFFFVFCHLLFPFSEWPKTTNLFSAGRNDPCRLFLASESSKKKFLNSIRQSAKESKNKKKSVGSVE